MLEEIQISSRCSAIKYNGKFIGVLQFDINSKSPWIFHDDVTKIKTSFQTKQSFDAYIVIRGSGEFLKYQTEKFKI